jgi:hypothetical protein
MQRIILANGMKTLVDDEDYKLLKDYIYFVGNDYIYRLVGRNQRIYIHREIINAEPGKRVFHLDKNNFNNQKNNLSMKNIAPKAQKIRTDNTSGYPGIKRSGRSSWAVYMKINGKQTYLGSHPSPEQAAQAYDSMKEQLIQNKNKID